MKAWPFVDHAKEEHISTEILQNPEQALKEKMASPFNFGTAEIMRTGHFKLMGYRYDFRPWLTRFVYRQYGQWHEAYALNRTNLRKLVHGKIDEILDAN